MNPTQTHKHESKPRRRVAAASVLAALVGAMLCACAEEGYDGEVEMQLWDIVTYEGTNSDGGSRFSFRQIDDSPLVTLTSTASISGVEEGQRLSLRYIPESGEAYTSGPVTLLSAAKITQGAVSTDWKEDYEAWNRDKVYVNSMWRSGQWLNLNIRLTYDKEPRTFLLAERPGGETQTASDGTADIWLVHIMASETERHDRAYLSSFDIGAIWNRPGLREMRVHVANSNLDKDIFTFVKNN